MILIEMQLKERIVMYGKRKYELKHEESSGSGNILDVHHTHTHTHTLVNTSRNIKRKHI
jgi:hypothetical protein